MSGAPGAPGAQHPFVAATATAPELTRFFTESFRGALFEGDAEQRVPLRVKQLVRLRLEALYGVRYPDLPDPAEAGVTAAEAAAAGGPLDALPASVSEAERAVLALVDEIEFSNMEGYLGEELYARLRPHFADGAIFELGHATATLCGFAKFLTVFGLEG